MSKVKGSSENKSQVVEEKKSKMSKVGEIDKEDFEIGIPM